jgi:hypothetical protein
MRQIDEEYDDFPNYTDNDLCKRKRTEDDSFDNISLMSTDSYISGSATKKPKLTRTGSITRNIRRSMSFAAFRTPIQNMLKPRRSSVDPNASLCSITSIESTFNESIKKPVKEKFRMIRDKITKGKKDPSSTPKTVSKSKVKIASENMESLKEVCKFMPTSKTPESKTENDSCVGFKTPLAPPYSHTSFTTPSSTSLACKTRSQTIKQTQTTTATATATTTTKTTTTHTQIHEVVSTTTHNSIDPQSIENDELLLIKKRKSPTRKQKISINCNTTSCFFNELECPDADTMPVLI